MGSGTLMIFIFSGPEWGEGKSEGVRSIYVSKDEDDLKLRVGFANK